MRTYIITVNGNKYEVTVEGGEVSSIPAVSAAASSSAASGVPTGSAAKESTGAAALSSGAVKIEAGAAGKVIKIDASAGTKVSKGDTVVTLESMKMEIPMVAPEDGVVASVNVAVGTLGNFRRRFHNGLYYQYLAQSLGSDGFCINDFRKSHNDICRLCSHIFGYKAGI